jgi:hypothetical protein
MDVMNIGSMLGYNIDAAHPAPSCALITSLLNAGLSYVVSHSGRIMALFPCRRSMLLLHPCLPPPRPPDSTPPTSNSILIESASSRRNRFIPRLPNQLRVRARDMPRIFRNKIKKPLSLRVNSNLTLAIQKLREHHGRDCWVSGELEIVWGLMARTSPPMLLVFELWYGEELVAADFCHPVCGGRGVYVATRFFDRSEGVKTMQLGFLLALVECKYLSQMGCCVWDLGGVDLCPLMLYKNDLTGVPFDRAESLYLFRQVRDNQEGPVAVCIEAGVIRENICVDDLLSDGEFNSSAPTPSP